MNLFPYFSYFFTDTGAIRRPKSRHNATVKFVFVKIGAVKAVPYFEV